VEVFTIGFTQRSAEEFFESLRRAGIRQVIDVRLNNTSQLAGFAKRGNIEYLLAQLCQATYRHEPVLSPTKDILDGFKKKQLPWDQYECRFLALLAERQVEMVVDRGWFDVPTVLLCSELTAEHCHRRLVAEYLADKWGDMRIIHL
jgi:uncharacterized protein (DUF488 family)